MRRESVGKKGVKPPQNPFPLFLRRRKILKESQRETKPLFDSLCSGLIIWGVSKRGVSPSFQKSSPSP